MERVTTYGVREFKARVSEILRDLEQGGDVIITRRGRPCARLTPVHDTADDKPSLSSLRGAIGDLPDASYEDFLEIKALWRTETPPSAEAQVGDDG